MLKSLSNHSASLLWKLWYPLLTRLSKNAQLSFLNYGYAEDPPRPIPLDLLDEPDRTCIQLYHRIAATIDLQGLDLLEVSCGHGGGRFYITRYLKPRSMHALDRNPKAIALCKKRHPIPNLTFTTGNALALPFADNSFDALINVEASHCYPDLPRFFKEVHRVLRPGGTFLYADFRQGKTQLAQWHAEIAASPLQIIAQQNISPQVLRGMQLNHPKYTALVQKFIPKPLHRPAMSFAGTKNSPIYNALASGESQYLYFHLRKSHIPAGPLP